MQNIVFLTTWLKYHVDLQNLFIKQITNQKQEATNFDTQIGFFKFFTPFSKMDNCHYFDITFRILFFFLFLIEFNVPFKIISLIEKSQSIGGAKREYPGKTT